MCFSNAALLAIHNESSTAEKILRKYSPKLYLRKIFSSLLFPFQHVFVISACECFVKLRF